MEPPDSPRKNFARPPDSLNPILTDDCLRAVLGKLSSQSERDKFSLVCKRWLAIQSSERKRFPARPGTPMLLKLATRFTNLLELDFSQSFSRSTFPGVTDVHLQEIASSSGIFQALEFINLQKCPGITDSGLEDLAKGLPALKGIDLSDCKQVSDNGIRALVTGCSRLSSISFARSKLVSDEVLEMLSCTELKALNMSGCMGISDEGLQALASGCSTLETLDVSSCSGVGDPGLVSIASSNPGLRSISFSDCSGVTYQSLRAIVKHCRGSIRVLKMAGCVKLVNDASIGALVSSECGDLLESLDLSRCSKLSDIGVVAIFSQCARLWSIHLDACSRITDDCLDVLELHGDSLRHFSLAFCNGICDPGVGKIAALCRRLELVDFTACSEITAPGIAAAHFPPGCKIVKKDNSFLERS